MNDREKWLNSGEYLPPFLRDFHDQKDVFKWINFFVEKPRISCGRKNVDFMPMPDFRRDVVSRLGPLLPPEDDNG